MALATLNIFNIYKNSKYPSILIWWPWLNMDGTWLPAHKEKGFLLIFFFFFSHRLNLNLFVFRQKCATSSHWLERYPASNWSVRYRGNDGNATHNGATELPGRTSFPSWCSDFLWSNIFPHCVLFSFGTVMFISCVRVCWKYLICF